MRFVLFTDIIPLPTDALRYYLALLMVLVAPGIFTFWFSVHLLTRFWRKVGAELTLALHALLGLALAAGVFQI